MQLRRRGLQLHARPQAVRHTGAPSDKAVNLFLDVDKRCFHDTASISRQSVARKAIGMATGAAELRPGSRWMWNCRDE